MIAYVVYAVLSIALVAVSYALGRHRTQDEKYAVKYSRYNERAYNTVIQAMIDGDSPCHYCCDQQDCDRAERLRGGCEDWLLDFPTREELKQL